MLELEMILLVRWKNHVKKSSVVMRIVQMEAVQVNMKAKVEVQAAAVTVKRKIKCITKGEGRLCQVCNFAVAQIH